MYILISYGGGIILFIREDISSLLPNLEVPIEIIYIEINIRVEEEILVCSYNPNKTLFTNHFDPIQDGARKAYG